MIYMDNAATTRVDPEVLRAMTPYMTGLYGNPSAQYELGVESKRAIHRARKQISEAIGANTDEIYFTGSGSESNNIAIKGVCEAQYAKGKMKIITTNIEHPSVLNTCRHLERFGFDVCYIPVDSYGFVTAGQVEEVIDDRTAMVSVMFANNEIGSIQPIAEIGGVCRRHGVPFHVDAVQALGSLVFNVEAVDLMSFSGHKIHAPKGIGCLYIREGVECASLVDGGGQERGLRSGTENVASIVGFGKAVSLITAHMDERIKKIEAYRNRFASLIVDGALIQLNGTLQNRLCGNLNVSFRKAEGESIALQLASYGICVSAKSACSAGNLEPSHVMKALGVDKDYLYGSVRFSFNEDNTERELEKVVDAIKRVVIFNGE